MRFSLRISGKHYEAIRAHLFPGDNLEAIAFGLCGSHITDEDILLTVCEVLTIPYEVCGREQVKITWPTELLAPLLDKAQSKGLSVIKFHSHPSDFKKFSDSDNKSDAELSCSVANWMNDNSLYGSVVLLPGGEIFGRTVADNKIEPLSIITVVGDDISCHHHYSDEENVNNAFEAHQQLFGAGTVAKLSKLKAGIIGCSGTGSIVLELLMRLGVGAFVLVDHDKIEDRNLNRIVNSKRKDIGRFKVEALTDAINSIDLRPQVLPIASNLFDPNAVHAVAGCDVLFGCMDTAEGRHLLNRIATFYIIPLFDLGVHLAADGHGGINEASGVLHYLQPGGSSLLSRKAYTMARVRAENLFRTDPKSYKDQFNAGYIEGVDEKSPAVASINATIASLAVNEFLARIHPYRSCLSTDCATVRFNFMETAMMREEESGPCPVLSPHVGRGDVDPLLDMPALSK